MALLGFAVGRNREIEAAGDGLDYREDGGALGAGYNHVLGAAPGIDGVVVEVEGGFGRRDERVIRVVFGSPQTAFFAGDREEQRRATRLLRKRGPGARQFEKDAAAGGVI